MLPVPPHRAVKYLVHFLFSYTAAAVPLLNRTLKISTSYIILILSQSELINLLRRAVYTLIELSVSTSHVPVKSLCHVGK